MPPLVELALQAAKVPPSKPSANRKSTVREGVRVLVGVSILVGVAVGVFVEVGVVVKV